MKTQPECVTADGGNSTLTNQDEALIVPAYEIGLVIAPGGAENETHISAQYREAPLGGA